VYEENLIYKVSTIIDALIEIIESRSGKKVLKAVVDIIPDGQNRLVLLDIETCKVITDELLNK
jgi:hypothetical protein